MAAPLNVYKVIHTKSHAAGVNVTPQQFQSHALAFLLNNNEQQLQHISQLSHFDHDSHGFRVLLTAKWLNSVDFHGSSMSNGGHAPSVLHIAS